MSDTHHYQVTDEQIHELILKEKCMGEVISTRFAELLTDTEDDNEDEMLDLINDFSEKYGLGLEFIGVDTTEGTNFVWDAIVWEEISPRLKVFTEGWLRENCKAV